MSTKVVVVLVAYLALAACAASGADQNTNRLAPGETRSIFNQGAVGRLRQMMSQDDDSENQGSARTPQAASPAPRRTAPAPATARATTRTNSRSSMNQRGLLNRPRTASRRPSAVDEITTREAVAGTTLANETSEATSADDTQTETENVAAQPTLRGTTTAAVPTVSLPRQQATLNTESQAETEGTISEPVTTSSYASIIKPAVRHAVPKQVATPPKPGETFEIPRAHASRLLARESAADAQSIEVGMSPMPRLISQEPATEEPAPAPPASIAASAEPESVSIPTSPTERATGPLPTAQPVIRAAPRPAVSQVVVDAPAENTRPVVTPPAPSGSAGVIRRVERPQAAAAAVAKVTALMTGPKEVYLGDTGIFKVRLINEGDAAATDVQVEIRADDAVMKTLSVGTIPAKGDVVVEIAVSPNRAGAMNLRAIVTGDQGVKSVAGSVVFIGKPELTLAIAGPPQMNFGELKLYTAILNNTGNCDATNVNVLVVLQGKQSQTLPVGIVPAGQTRQVRFELRPEQAGQLSVNAVATADGNVRAVANGGISVVKHDVQLMLDGPRQLRYGQKAVYTLVVSNNGTADAERLAVDVTFGESALDRLYQGTLAAGKQEKISFEVSPGKPGFHALQAVALGAGDLRAATSAKLQVQHGQLELAITKPTEKVAGAEATYKVQVKNTGDADANDVLVTAHLPAGVKYRSGVERIGFYEGIAWRVGPLTPGEVRSYDVKCELAAAGEHKVAFTATGEGQLETSQSVTTPVEALAEVRLFVAAPPTGALVGDDVIYEIEVQNRGVKTAQNVEVVMQVSPLIEPTHVEGSNAQLQARRVVFDLIPEIGPKQSIKLRVTARAKEQGNHPYRVEMTAAEPHTFTTAEGATRFYANTPLPTATTTGDE